MNVVLANDLREADSVYAVVMRMRLSASVVPQLPSFQTIVRHYDFEGVCSENAAIATVIQYPF